nr:uncharacterized protein LOC120969425 [Aegilops tauschii subsp. strangulata]
MGGATRDGSRDHGAGGDRRVRGRFWALVESDEEDQDDGRHLDACSPETASPTPSDHICEAFKIGYSEDEVALLVDEAIPQDDPARTGLEKTERIEIVRRVVHRRTAATAIRPWRGPLPKVIFRATALIRSWSLLTPTEARERLVTGSIRWEMVARDIFNRFGWRSCNRIGN